MNKTSLTPELVLMITAVLGLIINFSITAAGQSWARLTSQRYASVLLPPAGLIITWSISSNLALSLGMIGALSIVRFRTPIKNPFELVIFFCYLIVGISAGVDLKYAMWLTVTVLLTPIIVAILDFPLKKTRIFGKALNTKTEFSEDPVQVVLQIRSADITLPEAIVKNAVSSMAFTPSDDADGYLLDITASFDSFDEAVKCLQHAKDTTQVLHGAVQVLER